MLVSVNWVVDDVLVRVDSAQHGPAVDAHLDGRLRNLLRNEEDERDFVDAGRANEDCSWIVVVFRKLQVIWGCVHCFSWPLYMLRHVVKAGNSLIKCALLERFFRSHQSILQWYAQPVILNNTCLSAIVHSICESSVPDPFAQTVEGTEAFVNVLLLVCKLLPSLHWQVSLLNHRLNVRHDFLCIFIVRLEVY